MNKQSGFTLVELMITLSIAVILLTVGVPSFSTMIQNNRLTSNTNDLVSALNLARSEAVTRGVRVTVCKSSDQSTCDTSTTGWEQGWIIFTDENNNAAYNPSATPAETLLKVHEAMENQITATGNSNVANYISYVASGRSQLTSGAFQAGSISLCDARGASSASWEILSSTGRLRLAQDTNDDGIVDDGNGSNVTCP